MHYFERKQKLWCISHDLFGLCYRKRIGAGWHGGGSVVLQSLRINWSCCKKKIRRFKFGKGLDGSVSIIYHRDLGSAPWMHLIGREKAERKLSNLIHLRDTRRLEVVGGKTELKCMFALLPTFLNTVHTWGEGIPKVCRKYILWKVNTSIFFKDVFIYSTAEWQRDNTETSHLAGLLPKRAG